MAILSTIVTCESRTASGHPTIRCYLGGIFWPPGISAASGRRETGSRHHNVSAPGTSRESDRQAAMFGAISHARTCSPIKLYCPKKKKISHSSSPLLLNLISHSRWITLLSRRLYTVERGQTNSLSVRSFSRVAYPSHRGERLATLFSGLLLPLMMVFYNRRPQSVSDGDDGSGRSWSRRKKPLRILASRVVYDTKERTDGRTDDGPKKEASCPKMKRGWAAATAAAMAPAPSVRPSVPLAT